MQIKGSSSGNRKEEDMRYLLGQQASGGQTVKHFCKEQRLSVAMFYYWQKKLRSPGEMLPSGPGFQELDRIAVASSVGELFAEYKGIRFYQEPSASLLKELIG